MTVRWSQVGPVRVGLVPAGQDPQQVQRDEAARHHGVAPTEIRMTRGRDGKPEVAGGAVGVNLSRAGAWSLVAVAPGHDVGVDVEQVRPWSEVEALASRALAEPERVLLAASPHHVRATVFTVAWTAKEAVAKCTGYGLRIPFHRVACLAATDPVRLRRQVIVESATVEVRAVAVPPGWCAAVAWRAV